MNQPRGISEKAAYLMTCPGMAPQPFCSNPWCGKTGGQMVTVNPKDYGGYDYRWLGMEFDHVPPRGEVGDHNAGVIQCTECHKKHHSEHPLERDYTPEQGWIVKNPQSGEWQQSVVYDEQRDTIPTETEDVLGSLAADLRELKCSADQVDYFLSRELAEAEKRLHGDRRRLGEWCVDNLDISPRSVDSYLSKRIAYASLPESCSTLGITNGYKVFLLAQSASLDDVLRDYHTMSRSHFNEQYGLTKHREKCTCPSCGASHTLKEE